MEDSDDLPQHYDDGNRAFLQAFMARGTMTFKEAQPILAAIFSAQNPGEPATAAGEVTREDFESYVAAASAALSPFDMEIRSTTHQARRERVWALVNTTSDALTRLATLHSAEEIAFVRRVIDAMFERYNSPRLELMCLDAMQANKLRAPAARGSDDDGGGGEEEGGAGEPSQPQTQALRALKPSEVEAVLRSMVEAGWFERSRAGFYSLSARALAELRGWLPAAYNDADAGAGEWQRVKACEACREIVTQGQRCAERDCLARLHDACAEAFFRGRDARQCPRCAREWSGRHFVGERAVTESEAYRRGRRRSGRGGAGAAAAAPQEEEGEGEGEGEEGGGGRARDDEDGDGDEDGY
ncbi:Nse1 non-SMC component of SMC5-6 complex-domain-containing protein [Durotheca rogersii]|uniref:Nse1 non-SMC component of SMC5-6 complex-domain-containing protein n=1 Tax=Durotheca rogersii TaxID=419775 RepID=UPI00221EC1D6|nr:Nse1 non-SMC component of SMC5-6 complex-domain-containing protein [Durotheca rogersii]KAI5865093.1 Nse1 non-SMC component of SMC5-6 complex-domain-containing protein [Durotheca rogersii]